MAKKKVVGQVYEPGFGSHITTAIKECIVVAAKLNENVTFTFNDVLVTVTPNSTEDEVYNKWASDYEAKTLAWKNSPAGKAYEAEQAATKYRVITEAEQVMSEFDSVNWGNIDETLAFLDKTVEPFDWTYVTEFGYGKKILNKLTESGYVKGANCGADFNGEDKDNVARYLVGQAMSCFSSVGCIHHVYSRMYNDYKEKFTV